MAYAHTRIMTGADVTDSTSGPLPGQVGTITKRHYIEIGDTVSQKDLNVSDEEWEMLYRDGVVSDEKLPSDLDHENESLNQYKTRNAVKMLEEAGKRPTSPTRSKSRSE